MAASKAAEELNEITNSIGSQLSAFQDRGTQAEQGPRINPLRHVKHLDHGQPFAFQQPSRKVNWKRLRQLDLQAMVASGDTSAAMQLFEDVAYGDVESGSIYDLSEASLMKMIKLAQLQLQYMQYKLEEKVEAELALEDDSLAIAAGLSGLTAPSLGDIHKGLGALENDIKQLGNHKVRTEERHAAKSALMEAIQKTKQQVDLKYGVQLVSGASDAAGSS